MKIAIDISPILYGTGVAVYTKCLIENLFEIDEKNMYVLFGGSLRRKNELEKYTQSLEGNFSYRLNRISPYLADILWNRLHKYNVEKITGKVDIYHSSDWAQAPSKCYKVTTVHDLFPLRFPKMVDYKIASVHKARMKWVKGEVDRVIAPSNATMEDLKLLGILPHKISVIPEACDEFFSKVPPRGEVQKIKNKFNLKKYVLGIGIGERKNTLRIIEAVKSLNDPKMQVVLVGRNQESLDLGKTVVTGFVDNKTLRGLYRGAEMLIYPSLYEGFGLPILQAFAAGCPVITSNLSSMPEVAGSAAKLVDPYSVDDIASGIIYSIKHAIELKEKGKKRLESYSWLKTARETLKLYNNI